MRNKTTCVVNRHKGPYDVYIGRGSKFGNLFEIGKDGDRTEVIEKFKIYFYRKLKKERYRKIVESLRGKRLGCSCRPDDGFRGRVLCHGQIIVAYLEKIKPEEVK
jgi:hypothetical protein